MAWDEPVGRLPDPTPNEFADWLTPMEAFGELTAGLPVTLLPVIVTRLRAGKIFAAADSAICEVAEPHSRRLITIDRNWWPNVEGGLTFLHSLWSYGDVTIIVPVRGSAPVTVNFFGVKFEGTSLREVVPEPRNTLAASVRARTSVSSAPPRIDHRIARPLAQDDEAPPGQVGVRWSDLYPSADPKRMAELETQVAALQAAVTTKTPQGGGRPPKAFWEDMWVEMVRLMYVGDLKFSKLSEIEATMHEWIAVNGHEAGETVVRERARKLFAALQKEAGN